MLFVCAIGIGIGIGIGTPIGLQFGGQSLVSGRIGSLCGQGLALRRRRGSDGRAGRDTTIGSHPSALLVVECEVIALLAGSGAKFVEELVAFQIIQEAPKLLVNHHIDLGRSLISARTS